MDINRYAYAGNDPVNFSDPNGHNTEAPLMGLDMTDEQAASMVSLGSTIADYTPVVGDVKGYYEAETWGDYAIATVTLVPGTDALKGLKKVPNPGGKLGDAVTKARTNDVVSEIEARGNTAVTEAMVKTPNGYKRVRFADVAEVDPQTGKITRYHQIGETTKKGNPVSRERKAKADIEIATGLPVKYHDRRIGSSSPSGGSSGGGQTAPGTSSGWSFGKWWDSLWK